ncbi:hypothetical protein [Alicyclobacillus shizuokensis]|uniref:hypothetical protein n=1 Tax=Alicyclobacillus shizuokensis TaxID=392014 RepID=UPI000834E2EB|nr:hypothetical protein [Alicyclobacillus shizuokensis]MCL6627609.1 hypothetical protein [Alicyclobacillus shizuokensis]
MNHRQRHPSEPDTVARGRGLGAAHSGSDAPKRTKARSKTRSADEETPDVRLPDGVSAEWQQFYQAWIRAWRNGRR